MRTVFERLNAWPVRQRAAILEAAVYLALVIAWLIVWPADSIDRLILGNLIVAAPAAAAVFQIVFSLPSFGRQARRIWLCLGLALTGWTLRHLVWLFYGLSMRAEPPPLSVADVFGLLAYPFAIYGLLQFFASFRHAPLRFRFLLDMLINAGVVITLGWMVLGRAVPFEPARLVPILYPIADLVLLMTVVNLLLADRISRLTAIVFGVSLLGLTISDYTYSFLSVFQSYRIGTITSLGWVLGFLLLGNEAIRERQRNASSRAPLRPYVLGLGTQFQNILPVTLVLALFWFVLAEWQLRGEFSAFGFLMSILFSVILIVRMGIRAGEVELYRYWQLFSHLADPAFICDARGSLVLGNPALARLCGRDEGEETVVGRSLFSLFSEPVLPASVLSEASRAAVTYEVFLLASRSPYLLTLSPILGEGRRVMIAGVAHDLSLQKEQEYAIRAAYDELRAVHQQLAELNAQLEARVEERTHTLSEAYRQLEEQHRALQELDRLKTDFVSMVSHELRTPLNNLGGGVELLLSPGRNLAVSARGPLALMQAEIKRLTRFVENILSLSALDAGRLALHPVPLSLSVVVGDLLRRQLQEVVVERVDVRVPSQLPFVSADQTALESVLYHLVDNALKYAAEGPVIIEARMVGEAVRLQVTDCGPGIPPEKRHLLFQRFQRLDAHDSQSVYGYGLGLYLSRRLLEAMSSTLDFEPPAEGGARFYFDLKIVP